jgi:hypothetical protein
VDETCALCLGNMVMYIVVPYTEDIVLLMCWLHCKKYAVVLETVVIKYYNIGVNLSESSFQKYRLYGVKLIFKMANKQLCLRSFAV